MEREKQGVREIPPRLASEPPLKRGITKFDSNIYLLIYLDHERVKEKKENDYRYFGNYGR